MWPFSFCSPVVPDVLAAKQLRRPGFDARDDNDESRGVIRETIAFVARHVPAAAPP